MLIDFVGAAKSLFVLTGAGCSTESGIPDYRDRNGEWKRKQPMYYQEFMRSDAARQRYWARSFRGWPAFSAARPGSAHKALAELAKIHTGTRVVTQNVDGLHQKAGSTAVIDLHGRNDVVFCTDCGDRSDRQRMQERIAQLNPELSAAYRELAPDGDAIPHDGDRVAIAVPPCERCGGILKPDVVFFGESIPPQRARTASDWLAESDALLVVGSSLMVWSGFRCALAAAERQIPIAIVTDGVTRADHLATIKIEGSCGKALTRAVRELGVRP